MARFDYRRVEHLRENMKILQLSPGMKYMCLSNIIELEDFDRFDLIDAPVRGMGNTWKNTIHQE